jgi:hypothetical protein
VVNEGSWIDNEPFDSLPPRALPPYHYLSQGRAPPRLLGQALDSFAEGRLQMSRCRMLALIPLLALAAFNPGTVSALPAGVLPGPVLNAETSAPGAALLDDPYLGQPDFKNFIPVVGGCDQWDVVCEDHPVGYKCGPGPSNPCRCVADGRQCAVP